MKQNAIYLFKGLAFSSVIMGLFVALLAWILQKTQWSGSVMQALVMVCFCLSALIGGLYFSRHASAKAYLWGLFFGAAFYLFYMLVMVLISTALPQSFDHVLTFLALSLISGMAGGMVSQL